ncbi:MAG: ABC transporter permease [Thermomicrobiales bacterium]|nr:ABC transporter permease [Thermomicrobiales bacterium]
MVSYIIRRLLQGVVVVFIITFFAFAILQAAPGDPIDLMLGEGNVQMSAEQRAAILHKWGMDRPWYEQYFTWLKNFVSGDLGESIVRRGSPVSGMIFSAAIPTLKLNLIAYVIAIIISIPAGMLAAIKRYSAYDSAVMVIASAGVALPVFWVALMSIIFFSLKLGWLPPFGSSGWKAYILPVLALSLNELALLTRMMRGTMLEVLEQDYVKTARSKGLSEYAVIVGHAVRNALLPIITILGVRAGFLISGSVVVESIFAWPGLGSLFLDSVNRFDFQVVQAIVVLLTVFVLLANILTDLLYAVIDPRIRLNK